jgi:outer membrane receptor protein involved in Fe transport
MSLSNTLKGCLIVLLSILTHPCLSQGCKLVGVIIDDSTGSPLPYGNVIITSPSDSSIFLGAVANSNGSFVIDKISPGKYNVAISFIGYQTVKLDNLIIQKGIIDIGEIRMNIFTENLEAVTIRAIAPPVSYFVDRKVIDANSFPEAIIAMDLLENVPSVQVDINGELTYRGNGTFKVFINGHPVANGVEKLKQVPANTIKRIEIITNPSAKYDAEGTAGIIQIILKKRRLPGFAISANSSATTLGSYDFLFSIDKQLKKGGWYLNGNVGRYVFSRISYTQVQNILYEGILYETTSNLIGIDNGVSSSLELGFNYDLTNKNYVDFSAYISPLRTTNEYKSTGEIKENTYQHQLLESNYLFDSQYKVSHRYIGFNILFEHSISDSGKKKLSSYIDLATYLHPLDEKKIVASNYGTYTKREGFIGQEYNETLFEWNLDYENQVTEKLTIESGARIEMDHIPKVTSISGIFDEQDNITPFSGEPLNQSVDFKQDVFAAYIIFRSSYKKFECQLGLRSEFTDRKSNYDFEAIDGSRICLPAESQFWNWFPSFHTVYNFSESHQVAINYSRRINRPDYWKLVPLSQYDTPYSYYQGNGTLMPSYVNAFEIAHKKSWDKDFIGIEVFARNTIGLIENYSRVNSANLLVVMPENIGDSWSIGAELMSGVDIFDWWNVNISTNLYSYKLQIEIDNSNQVEKQLRSDSRISNAFYLDNEFTINFDINYRSPLITAQSRREGYFYSSVGVKKGFMENKLHFIVTFSNFLNSKKYSNISKGSEFRIATNFIEKPMMLMKISYYFNNQE